METLITTVMFTIDISVLKAGYFLAVKGQCDQSFKQFERTQLPYECYSILCLIIGDCGDLCSMVTFLLRIRLLHRFLP